MSTVVSLLRKGRIPLLIFLAAVALWYAWRAGREREEAPPEQRTQQAQGSAREIVAEARLVTYPGASAMVGSEIGGTVVALPVQEKDAVVRGQLLAVVRADDLEAELSRAKARLSEVEADLTLADTELRRAGRLLKAEVVPRQQWEQAQRDFDATLGRKRSVEAEVRRIRALLRKSRILSPINGTVTARHLEPGETVQPGARIVTVADLTRTRVEAEVDEFDVFAVRVGDPVTVTAEGSEVTWGGKVQEIPDSVSQRRIKPQDPSKPSDARVLLVKIALDAPAQMKLGQRLEVRIHCSGRR